jgi:ABC-type nickel/cobalt efflux system permease component RcnA
MSGSWIGIVELTLVFGAGVFLAWRELRGLRRDTEARRAREQASAAARHAEGQQDLDPAPREPVER